MTVRDVFARTIVRHARNHLVQLRATRLRSQERHEQAWAFLRSTKILILRPRPRS